MHQRTPTRRPNFDAPTAAGANFNADQTDQRHRIRGTASAAKHTVNHTTTTNATTSASRNALRGAVQTDQQHNLHQRSLRQPNYHHRCCRWRQLQHNRRLSKAPQAPLLTSPTNTTHQATQNTQRHRPDRPEAPQEPQSLRPPI